MRSRQFLGGLLICGTLITATTFAASINVNGTCEVGTCSSSDERALSAR